MTPLTKLTEYSISQRLGQIEEFATAKTKDFSVVFAPDQNVEISVANGQRNFFVAKARRDIKLNDIEQSLECVSPIAKNAKFSSTKTLTYITMTFQEYDDFNESVSDFGLLDYVPLIRFGDDFGVGGWSMRAIIDDLSGRMGVPIFCLLPSYWIKQFSISPSTSYWQAILQLVSPLKPQVFSVGGAIFIIGDIGAIFLSADNVFSPNARLVSEEVVRPENPYLLNMGGDLGFFRPSRYKGETNTDYREFTKYFGDVKVTFNAYGYEEETSEAETGSIDDYDFKEDTDMYTGMVNSYTKEILRRGFGLDVFGKRAFEVGEEREFYKHRANFVSTAGGNPYTEEDWLGSTSLVLFRRESKGTFFKNTGYYFLSPIEINRLEIISGMVWHFPQGTPVFEFYDKLKEKKTEFTYSEEPLSRGALLSQVTFEHGAVYTENKKEFKPLEVLQKDDIVAGAEIQKISTLTETINYMQHTKDSYGVRRNTTFLGADGKFKTESEFQAVQAGAVQGEREQYRKMPVYAEKIIGGTAPPQEKRIFTPAWESIELLTDYLALLESTQEIYRTYEIPDELDVHLGLQVAMGVVTHPGNGAQIPAPSLNLAFRPVIVAYEIKNSLHRKSTTITVKGRLN